MFSEYVYEVALQGEWCICSDFDTYEGLFCRQGSTIIVSVEEKDNLLLWTDQTSQPLSILKPL